jgi:WhiB family transcriptional regulator, redox-sensing transcriptional regulator
VNDLKIMAEIEISVYQGSVAAQPVERPGGVGSAADDLPGIEHPPAGRDFDDFLERESSIPLPEPIPFAAPLPSLIDLLDPDDPLIWQERALCAETDPEAFFPEKGGSTREAKKVCVSCEVRSECLEYALEHDERFGIWGGLSERERRRLKKEAV